MTEQELKDIQEMAINMYTSESVQFSRNPQVTPTKSGTGYWVKAWVYVEKTGIDPTND